MIINLLLTDPDTRKQFPVCWGPNMIACVDDQGRNILTTPTGKGGELIRENPADVIEQIRLAMREQRKYELTAKAMQGLLAHGSSEREHVAELAVGFAESVLKALRL
jgi:hypothetical protein